MTSSAWRHGPSIALIFSVSLALPLGGLGACSSGGATPTDARGGDAPVDVAGPAADGGNADAASDGTPDGGTGIDGGSDAPGADVGDATEASVDAGLTLIYDKPGDYHWLVPAGITTIVADVYGAEGGENFASYPTKESVPGMNPGGKGAHITATLAVTPGQNLEIEVGEKGLYVINISAKGWTLSQYGSVAGLGSNGRQLASGEAGTDAAGNGGAASAIVLGGATPQALVVAGAGGGAAAIQPPGSVGFMPGGRGGDSGHPGSPGLDIMVEDAANCVLSHGSGGQAGTPTAPGMPGLGGASSCAGLGNTFLGNDGMAGDGTGPGGNGGTYGAGGGGGGYHGGGGGGSGAVHAGVNGARVAGGGGGGGGSSFVVATAAASTIVDGVRVGDGRVEIRAM